MASDSNDTLSSSAPRILIVDDEEAARYALSRMLRSAGYEILEAATGSEALELAARELPDLILLDVLLPDRSGYEICRELKSQAGTSLIPVIQTSASFAEPKDQARGLDGGADSYLIQPILEPLLLATVSALLRNRKLVQDFRRAHDELHQALQLRDEFLSIASHELKTPLAGLRLQLQMLERNLRKAPDQPIRAEDLQKSLSVALRQSGKLVEMLERLLDLSRLRNKRLHLEITAADLCELVHETLLRLSILASSAGSVLNFRSCQPLIAYVDPARIDQVISNLITNAIKYGQGKPVDISVESEGSDAMIRVRDQGIGISKEDQARIFGRYERATEDKARESLGLGLFIAGQIAEAHGGSLSVESEPGEGATFILRLPMTQVRSFGKELNE